ncbi:class I SAM-dependent methyltransferase [Nocardia sp. CA2R105]|uniref:class I SAM-dependent methyltransferase n=1 Tax=Nocardia coffeae TaxID=2873381 RepID=UPI001CA772FC|nr:class I SAM-dependent methyltransferase [Nocardia coffeae]MBY8856594.1 class I SAM-dependent methyltransferase [Nocardia coffeae]
MRKDHVWSWLNSEYICTPTKLAFTVGRGQRYATEASPLGTAKTAPVGTWPSALKARICRGCSHFVELEYHAAPEPGETRRYSSEHAPFGEIVSSEISCARGHVRTACGTAVENHWCGERSNGYGRSVPDPIFADSRLALLYDEFEGDRADLGLYMGIADEIGAELVVDIGCGTGSLAVQLAHSGRSVVAIDPAEASLEVAKAKPASTGVTWLRGRATDLPAAGADLAVMTGNVAQVFLTDQDWADALDSIHYALRGGGHLAFETRRPERRAWEDWAESTGAVVREIPDVGRVEQRLEVTAVDLPFVSIRHTYTFTGDDSVVVSDSTLRFRARVEIESDLRARGYRLRDVRDAPDRPGREFVFIAEAVS